MIRRKRPRSPTQSELDAAAPAIYAIIPATATPATAIPATVTPPGTAIPATVTPATVTPATAVSTAKKPWIDNPDPRTDYRLFLDNSRVQEYLQFTPLPLAYSNPNLEKIVSDLFSTGAISSFAPIFGNAPDSTTILVKMNPLSTYPDYNDVCPILELKRDSSSPHILLRFQIPTCTWSPIPKTVDLFPENKETKEKYEKLVKQAPPGTIIPRLFYEYHVFYRMLLPKELQADPFTDEAPVEKSLLPPDTAEKPAPWRTMNLPRLRGNHLNWAIDFREKLAELLQNKHFININNLEDLMKWLNNCLNSWVRQRMQMNTSSTSSSSTSSSSTSSSSTSPSLSSSYTAASTSTSSSLALSSSNTSSSLTLPLHEDNAKYELNTIFDTPFYWTKHNTPNSIKPVRLPLSLEDPVTCDEFKRIKNHLLARIPSATIHEISRVENGFLWDRYQLALRQYEQEQPPEGKQSEQWLWHYTREVVVSTIIQQGLDPRKCRPPHLLGRGTYFFTRPTNQLAKTPSQKQYVFFSRALTGYSSAMGRADFTTPPPMPRPSRPPASGTALAAGLFDPVSSEFRFPENKESDDYGQEKDRDPVYTSTTDDPTNPSIYVLYDSAHIYPAYLLVYSNKPQAAAVVPIAPNAAPAAVTSAVFPSAPTQPTTSGLQRLSLLTPTNSSGSALSSETSPPTELLSSDASSKSPKSPISPLF